MLLILSSPLSLYSIPVVWFTAFYPGTLKFMLIDKTMGYNNVQPRANTAHLVQAKGVSQDVIDRVQRMEGAHQNGNETFPLWAAAILAANYAGLDNHTLNVVSLAYIGTRLLYNHVYINHNSLLNGWARSILFFTALPMPLWLLVKSANKLADKD